jgi:hypothetical protein
MKKAKCWRGGRTRLEKFLPIVHRIKTADFMVNNSR